MSLYYAKISKTVVGGLSSIINPKSLVATSTAGLAVNLIAGMPVWSLLSAGGVLVGHAALSIATAVLERRDVEMVHREVAYVQEIKTGLVASGSEACEQAG